MISRIMTDRDDEHRCQDEDQVRSASSMSGDDDNQSVCTSTTSVESSVVLPITGHKISPRFVMLPKAKTVSLPNQSYPSPFPAYTSSSSILSLLLQVLLVKPAFLLSLLLSLCLADSPFSPGYET
ncbi:hypothetical protein PCANC_17089 [Puccinia coronata f. sp. avenae]|uniref:Uncharacterized protein n=1 Tax=Puccinia coronata f. sp. avenae TaxID=200324 RepID=A0A2N5ST23_9BASI|nr:hypothetical protein PCANC_17089 [Puccinia coronata f. sp. avenae]PLW16736.1 hypothetical protein PCASD_20613 [Puccinia coronata f. sp. avenae]